MKLKFTKAKKANRICIRMNGLHSVPVFWRRVQGIIGADSKHFDALHPSLAFAVEGYKQRMAAAEAAEAARKKANQD